MSPLKHNIKIVNIAAIAALIFLLTGCSEKEPQYVEVQEVNESPVAAESSMQVMPDDHNHGEANQFFQYEKPEGWSERVPSSMILMAFQTGSPPELLADVSISAFPGDVGGQLANVNRWRRQVGLSPVAPEALDGFVTTIEISGTPAWQVEFAGPASASAVGEPVKMVVSAVSVDGKTWFFKMMGTKAVVDAEKSNYDAFLSSIQF